MHTLLAPIGTDHIGFAALNSDVIVWVKQGGENTIASPTYYRMGVLNTSREIFLLAVVGEECRPTIQQPLSMRSSQGVDGGDGFKDFLLRPLGSFESRNVPAKGSGSGEQAGMTDTTSTPWFSLRGQNAVF